MKSIFILTIIFSISIIAISFENARIEKIKEQAFSDGTVNGYEAMRYNACQQQDIQNSFICEQFNRK